MKRIFFFFFFFYQGYKDISVTHQERNIKLSWLILHVILEGIVSKIFDVGPIYFMLW